LAFWGFLRPKSKEKVIIPFSRQKDLGSISLPKKLYTLVA
jgi:hypothetical protein